MLRVADWIISRLAEEGLEHIFLLPGGGAMHLNDALAREQRITPIPCHHEQACGVAAEAYGRTDNPGNPGFGVALVTTGPGATNILTPVTGAWIDSIPMLVISGQVKRQDRLAKKDIRQSGVQEVDIASMARGVTKYFASVDDPYQVRSILEFALAVMKHGRPGPVWIEVPLDVQATKIDPTLLAKSTSVLTKTDPISLSQLQHIKQLLRTSKRPLLLAGHGVRLAGAAATFRKLVEALKLPTVLTWNALDLLPYDSPYCIGSPGVVALRAPNFAVQSCDLLISVGCRLDNVVTAYNPNNFAPEAHKVIVDIDSAELSSHTFKRANYINADAGDFLSSLSSTVDDSCIAPSDWLYRCGQWKERYPVCDGNIAKLPEAISHYELCSVLSDILKEDTLISTGSSGLAIEVFYSTFRVKSGQRLFLTSGLGSMGYGLPAAIGACIGSGGKRTIALESDGSFMLNLQELATLKQQELPISIIILDNGGYASINNTQRGYFDGRYIATNPSSGLYIPDLAHVAGSFGIPSLTINSSTTLASDLSSFLREQGPAVCVVKLNSLETLWPKVSAIPQPDGGIISMPLEDMSPLLPIEVLEQEMNGRISEQSYKARRVCD